MASANFIGAYFSGFYHRRKRLRSQEWNPPSLEFRVHAVPNRLKAELRANFTTTVLARHVTV